MPTATLLRTTPRPVPLTDELERVAVAPWPDSLYEVIDGQIVEKPPMGSLENYINNRLAELLIVHVHGKRLGRIHVESLFHIGTDRNLKRRPDFAFVSAKRWPIGKLPPPAEAWRIVPDLAVEVTSDTNTANEIVRKVEDYFAAGVCEIWIVYPCVRKVYVYSNPTSVRILSEADDLDGGKLIPGFRVPVKEIFGDESTEEADIPVEGPLHE